VLSDPLLACCYPVALRPKRKPHLAVRTKYIGTVDGTLSGELEIWDRRIKLPAPVLARRTSCLDTIALAWSANYRATTNFIAEIFQLQTALRRPAVQAVAAARAAARHGHRLMAAVDKAP
jgi:hypothetical protein